MVSRERVRRQGARQLQIVQASSERELDGVFGDHLAQGRAAAALVIAPDALFISRSDQLAELTLRHGMPAISQFREFAVAGGLMSYTAKNYWQVKGRN
jgi:putative ABC transport system substrate-binding protein